MSASMTAKECLRLRCELDESYIAFCDALPLELRSAARDLPYRLRLANAPGVPFSQVFGHEVTFAAPALLAEAMPAIVPAAVRDAVVAHALAVIDAFGTDRLEDRQIPPCPEIAEILAHLRDAQKRALARVAGERRAVVETERARGEMMYAIRAEQDMMLAARGVDFACYERTALGKTGIGTPASVALARAAGLSEPRCGAVRATLSSVWLGMQYHDDALDWEDDFRRQSAWALLLARGAGVAIDPHGAPASTRNQILGSGILARMLAKSCRHFRTARRYAEVIGARTLAAWAKSKEEHARFLALEEAKNAGYAVRLYTLSPWLVELAS
jgi:hypothetical protein